MLSTCSKKHAFSSKPLPLILTLPENLFPPNPIPLLTLYQPQIHSFLQSLLTQTQDHFFYQPLSLQIEELCRNNEDKPLFSFITQFFDNFFTTETSLLAQDPDNVLLNHAASFWMKISKALPILSGVFRFFESKFLRGVLRIRSLETFLLSRLALAWKDQDLLKWKLIEKTLNLIKKDREESSIVFEPLESLLKLIQGVPELYSTNFEPLFIEKTEEFYKEKAGSLCSEGFSLKIYLGYVEKVFGEEKERVLHFLQPSSLTELIRVLEKELILNQLSLLLDIGFGELIEQKDLSSLQRLYSFISQVSKVEALKKAWGHFIREKGKNMVLSLKEGLFDWILGYRRNLMSIVKESFEGNKTLKSAIDGAFEGFLNLMPNHAAELASKQFDTRLRKGGKNVMEEEEVREELDELFEVFRYLTAKDVFEEFYNRRLAKRALFGSISSMVLEQHVLEKLKEECGGSYTKKSEEIFKDVELSKAINHEFETRKQVIVSISNIEFYVTVLHSNSWPLANKGLQTLIEPFETLRNQFLEFYNKKQLGVLLSWQFEGSFCELHGFFKGEKYLLNVSILQAMVLLLFNRKKSLSFEEMKDTLKFEEEELRKNLFSLYLMKEKLLLKSGEAKNIGKEDFFSLNEQYHSKLKRIKVNSLQKKDTPEDIQNTQDKVLQERQYLVDAAIVRVIKGKKKIGHNELINEVFNELKLPVSVADTKKRIESLIGRDYMSRDKNNPQLYHYVA